MQKQVWRVIGPLLLFGAVIFGMTAPVMALDVPPVPKDVPIVDQTNTLTPDQISQLAAMIAAERQHSGNQIGILMIPSLQGQVLEDYSIQVARTWGIGAENSDNGVLLLIVKNDHKVRIEVGYGLEGALTDLRSGRIIRDRMAPLFQQGKYFEGIQSGLTGITTAIHNEVDPELQDKPQKAPFPWEPVFAGLFIVPTWLAAILGRTKSWWAGGVIGGVAGIAIGLLVLL